MPLLDHSPGTVRWIALLIGTLAAISLIFSVTTAIKNEVTGTAIYRSGPRSIVKEPVTRASHPIKFKEANDKLWFRAIISLGISSIGIYFFRRLSY